MLQVHVVIVSEDLELPVSKLYLTCPQQCKRRNTYKHLGHTTGGLPQIMMEVWYVRGGRAGRNHHTYGAGLVQPVDPPSQHSQSLTGGFGLQTVCG